MIGFLTCSALSCDPVAEISTMSHHTQCVLPPGDQAMETPLCQVSVFPVFLLSAIRIVENQLIKVEIPRGWRPAEPKAVCHILIRSLEMAHRGWDLNRKKKFLVRTKQSQRHFGLQVRI